MSVFTESQGKRLNYELISPGHCIECLTDILYSSKVGICIKIKDCVIQEVVVGKRNREETCFLGI